ncbi:MAG TPA: NAD(P)/FAD-dependent oxidoreductase [Thermoanaerobaculia bacterium]|nr:NAD(P)/FAD-dependent oxidoreductase [Thermoanaerobaculia bacterium]
MIYDAIIVGGGPAGLTCAIFLGRYRRPVLVIDSGRPRNYATTGLHGFLGHHSIAPAELLRRGREEAESVGVELRDGKVTKIGKVGDAFEVAFDGETLRARRIVLAYGVRDTIPDIEGIETYYGKTVHHCPDCDGYESRDQRIGVIGWSVGSVGLALKLLQWSDDVVLFTHGHEREWDDEEHSKLLAERIDVKDEKIVALDGHDANVTAAVLSTGERVPVGRLFFNIHVERSTTLAEDLGCEVDPEKPNVIVDEHRQTTVEGVYAVGDLAAGSQLAITAAADGAIAAIAINKSLLPPSRQV